MTIQLAQQQALLQLKTIYEVREAGNIADWVMEHVTSKKRIDRLLDKTVVLTGEQEENLANILKELATHKPVQYVLGEAWFGGLSFFVNEHVLIPRPETEELVEWIWESEKLKVKSQKLLDIGSGSGCIPVTLKKRLPDYFITSIDVSEAALAVAQKNADTLSADVSFLQIDFLDESQWKNLPVFDLIVSNPPYIKQSEEKDMAKHVLAFEPSIALFVPDEDALLFYRKIVQFAKEHLTKNGHIFLEINEALGKEVIKLYESHGYVVELKKDMQDKDRMIKAFLPPIH